MHPWQQPKPPPRDHSAGVISTIGSGFRERSLDKLQTQPCQNVSKSIFSRNRHIHEVLTHLYCVIQMTMDPSLRVQAGAIKTRNVLTRAERVARLQELDRFDEEASVVGMPKVRVMKVSLKRKKKVKKADDDK